MDQLKIGRFIAERRREQGLTQAELAEKLHITDRAVSKWETGRGVPDSSIMLALCELLDINVNDLLSGEKIEISSYNRELENKLLEMIKEKEQADKRLLTLEWIIGIFSMIILFLPILMTAYLPVKDWVRVILLFSGFIPAIIGFGFSLKIEQVAGYYECKLCGHRYVPTFKAVNMAPHMGRTRKMTCPACGKKSWQKKVVSKD